MTREKKILITLIPLALLLCGGVIYLQLFHDNATPTQSVPQEQENTSAWVDDINAEAVVKVNKAAAIRQSYQTSNPNKQLYDGIVFGEDTLKEEKVENKTEPGIQEGPQTPAVAGETEEIKPVKKRTFIKKKITEAAAQAVSPAIPAPVPAPVPQRVRKGFLGSNGAEISAAPESKTPVMDCAVIEDVKVVSGSIINLMLQNNVEIKGEKILKNTIIQAQVSFDSKRMNLNVSSIGQLQGNWEGYDTNGNKGFVITGQNTTNNEIAQDAAEDAVSTGTYVAGQAINVPLLGRLGSNIGSRKMQDRSMTVNKGFKVKLK